MPKQAFFLLFIIMSSYIAIDLKSFYASVECVERGFDPLKTNLVVADESRTEKTICLAVSPSLKAYGIGGRSRLFEVVQKVKEINAQRLNNTQNHRFTGDSFFDDELQNNPSLALNYYIAPPRMSFYMKYSSKIYDIYLKYVSKDDIHVYSIDEVLINAEPYLNTYKMSVEQFATCLVKEVFAKTGITATCGIGTNLYLAKVAMDIVAKHMPADENGCRIAKLDEMTYRKLLWDYQPLSDFWRIGKGISHKLAANGMYCQGDIARMSINDIDKLYKLFGINAELIIDHAWGIEPVTIKQIKAYRPISKSLTRGQVLKTPYSFDSARLIIKEMSDLLSLDLFEKSLLCNQLVLTVGYDVSNNKNNEIAYTKDYYGRIVPKPAHGSINIEEYTNATFLIVQKSLELFDRIVDKKLSIRRMSIVANHLIKDNEICFQEIKTEQLDLFNDYQKDDKIRQEKRKALDKEKKMQQAILKIRDKYGKNAILKGNNFEEGATTIERNQTVGGHKA